MKRQNAERLSDRELVSSRIIDGPSHSVFDAWSKPDVFKKWWVPASAPIQLVFCEMDVRTAGTYKLVFSTGDHSVEFFGRYLEVVPYSRLVWTNEEGGAEASTITTVTIKEVDYKTSVTVHDLYPSKHALDEAITTGSSGAMPEQLDQLNQLITGRQ